MAFKGAYNVVIAITSLSVLYRENPDMDVYPEFQQNVAVESAITLLEEQQNILMGDPKICTTSKKKDTEVIGTRPQILTTAEIKKITKTWRNKMHSLGFFQPTGSLRINNQHSSTSFTGQ